MAKLEFDAVIQAGPGGGALVRLPAEAGPRFGTRARFAVHATFNGVEYRGSTMPMGDGTFCLGVTKAVQARAGAKVGDTVQVVIERDTEERTIEVPEELAAALEKAKLSRTFDAMAYTRRKEQALWVANAKKPETRQRRVAKVIEMFAAGERS